MLKKNTELLIIGAGGFLGKNLILFLNKKKIKVNVIVHSKKKFLNFINKNQIKNVQKIINIDLSQKNNRLRFLDHNKNYYVIDAGWIGVFGKFRNRNKQLLNIIYTNNIIKIFKNIKIIKLISFGSQAEYGNYNYPISENAILNPKTKYGKVKLSKYKLLNYYCKKEKINFTWFRIFSCYGPFENRSWLIPYVIKKLISKKKIYLTEGTQIWNYLYIDDIISAIILSLKSKKFNGIYNLGSEKSYTIKEIVNTIAKIVKIKSEIFYTKKFRKDQVFKMIPNIKKIKKHRWKENFSLVTGLRKTIKYYKNLK